MDLFGICFHRQHFICCRGTASYLHQVEKYPHKLFDRICGTFIYIGASDLLPSAHDRINWLVVISVISGAAIVPFIEYVLGI